MNEYVDKYTNKIVKKVGFRKAYWLKITYFLIGAVFVINMFTCWARPDFITSLVCALAVFFLNDVSDINRDKFRGLPFLLLVSVLYDFIWLFFL